DVPAVVRERRDLSLRPVVDLFPGVLAHVTDVEVAVCAVEREAPRVPETEPDDLPARAASKRIDPQQLAELLAHALRAVARITPRAAVAHAHVEKPVRVELQLAAVVVRERLMHEEELPRRRRDRAAVAGPELDYARISVAIRVVHVEAMVLRVVGMECNREQPLLTAARDLVPDVQKRAAKLGVHEVPDSSNLLDRVEAPRLRRSRGDGRERGEPLRERSNRKLLLRLRGREREGGGCEDVGEHSPKRSHATARRFESLPTS